MKKQFPNTSVRNVNRYKIHICIKKVQMWIVFLMAAVFSAAVAAANVSFFMMMIVMIAFCVGII